MPRRQARGAGPACTASRRGHFLGGPRTAGRRGPLGALALNRKAPSRHPGSATEVFLVSLKLGLTSFGGPIAHLAYFRTELVERRRWLAESQFAQLLALCQFLPGPASSQLGFGLGLLRAGCPGALAALAAAAVLVAGSASVQLLVVAAGAVAGLVACGGVPAPAGIALPLRHGVRSGVVLLAVFALLLAALPLAGAGTDGLGSVAAALYRAGALVFGGGHVVLPLLEESVVAPGWVSREQFLAGYGAAQALPGPLFAFAGYLGALLPGAQGGLPGALTALAFIFLPGFLLLAGVLPLWQGLLGHGAAARAVAGVNAAVVGLLGAALYDPVFVTAVRGPLDLAMAGVAFTLLAAWRVSALWVVAGCVAASIAAAALS